MDWIFSSGNTVAYSTFSHRSVLLLIFSVFCSFQGFQYIVDYDMVIHQYRAISDISKLYSDQKGAQNV